MATENGYEELETDRMSDDELMGSEEREEEEVLEGEESKGEESEGEEPEGEESEGEESEGEESEGEEPEGEEPEGEEPEGEESEGAEAEDDEGEKRRPMFVPKSRFDFKNRQLSEAQKQIQELQSQLQQRGVQPEQQQRQGQQQAPQSPLAQIDANLEQLDEQIAQAVADGDTQAFRELNAQARRMQDQRYSMMMQAQAMQATSQTRDDLQYSETLDAVEEALPQLNPDNEAYDADMESEVLSLLDAFVAAGQSRSDALIRAVNYVAPTYQQEQEAPPAPPAEKRKTDVKRNLKTAARQPANIAKAGSDSSTTGKKGKPDIMRMSQEEFEALTEEELDLLRGA